MRDGFRPSIATTGAKFAHTITGVVTRCLSSALMLFKVREHARGDEVRTHPKTMDARRFPSFNCDHWSQIRSYHHRCCNTMPFIRAHVIQSSRTRTRRRSAHAPKDYGCATVSVLQLRPLEPNSLIPSQVL